VVQTFWHIGFTVHLSEPQIYGDFSDGL